MKEVVRLWILIVVAIVVGVGASYVLAQEKPAEKETAPVPTVPEDAKRLLDDLRTQDAGYARAQAVLQKERDAITAEFSRQVGRLQLPGYELTPAWTYVKKAAPKTDPPK